MAEATFEEVKSELEKMEPKFPFKLLGHHDDFKRGDVINLTLKESEAPIFANKIVRIYEEPTEQGRKEILEAQKKAAEIIAEAQKKAAEIVQASAAKASEAISAAKAAVESAKKAK